MGYLGTLLASGTPGPTDDFWYGPAGTMTAAGVRVDAEGAQKMSAYYRGVDLLSTSLAMLPLPVWCRLPNDEGRDVAGGHPLYDVLHRKPNPFQDSFRWRRQAMRHLIHHGNAYNRIVEGPRGFVDELRPIHPKRVTPTQEDSGRILYHVQQKAGTTTIYTQDEIFHLCGACDDGVEGKGVLDYARDSIGLGLVLESYASRLFSQGALHGGVVKTPGPMTQEAAAILAQSFVTNQAKFHLPRILINGADWTPTTMDPEKAQMILSRKFSIDDIARWLGVPPHMIGSLDRSTNNNIEHQGLEFVTYSLGPWLSLWEFAVNDQLILRPEAYYAEFVRDALVRGDIATRWQTYVAGVNAGILAPNEPRVKENLKKFPGGDTPREPKNITGNTFPPKGQKPAPTKDPDDELDDDDDDTQDDQARAIAQQSAGRLLRKEIAAMQRLAVRHAGDGDAHATAVTAFYVKHAVLVAETLHLTTEEAEQYCAGQASQIVSGDWIAALGIWKTDDYAAGLAGLALDEAA